MDSRLNSLIPVVRYCVYISILFAFLVGPVSGFVKTSPLDDVKKEVGIVQEHLQEVRRDQLNYQIERDLLKEAYSSNLNKVNQILGLLLGAFSLIGFFGLRDIGALRKDYLTELEKLGRVRDEFEQKSKGLERLQEKVQADYLEIIKRNDEQSGRIKVLELKEKADEHINSKNYDRALEYIAVALEIDPKNTTLLIQKGYVALKNAQYLLAIETYEKVLEIEPMNDTAAMNSLETSLCMNNLALYENLSKQYASLLAKKAPVVQTYFGAFKALVANDADAVKSVIARYVETLSDEKNAWGSGWDYNDARIALRSFPDTPARKILISFLDVLQGKVAPTALRKSLAGIS